MLARWKHQRWLGFPVRGSPSLKAHFLRQNIKRVSAKQQKGICQQCEKDNKRGAFTSGDPATPVTSRRQLQTTSPTPLYQHPPNILLPLLGKWLALSGIPSTIPAFQTALFCRQPTNKCTRPSGINVPLSRFFVQGGFLFPNFVIPVSNNCPAP